ncbi:MAG: hypothetical protein V2I43_11815 [Parvularcula sp.]|nr:hypothetical protein [Parvularcula sp.]
MTHDPISLFKPTNSEELASNPEQNALLTALERDARLFAARQKDDGGDASPSRRFVIVDLEFAYDRSGHQAYKTAEGKDAEDIRWPFHTIACACWMMLRFDVGGDVPAVEELSVIANDEANEREIAEGLFAVLNRYPESILLTWAGESKDLPVLRRVAARHDLLLPPQLRDPNIYCRERLDMCRAVAARASFPHLPEYAAATCVPCKPTPSKSVGRAVEQGGWLQVRDQCLADVLATATIAVRHLNSHSKISCHPQRSITALAEAAASRVPGSAFVRTSFGPWARSKAAEARLRGTVIRAG